MKKVFLCLTSLLMSISVLLACAAPEKEARLPPPHTSVIFSEEKKAGWEVEWEQTLKAAQKEGKLVILTSSGPTVRIAVSEAFKKRTGIETEFIAGRGGETSAKLFAERRAGLHLVDIYSGGSTTSITTLKPAGVLAPLKPLLFLPEVLDPNAWFQKKLPWVDREENLNLTFSAFPAGAKEIGWNTNLVRKEEVFSYFDLLKPKFKGMMNMQDPTSSGKGLKWFQAAMKVYPGIDLDYMKALARQEPLITRDKRLQMEWLAKGRHLVAILPDNTLISDFMSLGAPVDYLSPKEVKPRIATGDGSLALIKDAPHPNAAKLFANWLLSREGLLVYSKAYPAQSSRVDLPTDFLPLDEVRQPGLDYFVEDEEFLLGGNEAARVSREIFGHLVR